MAKVTRPSLVSTGGDILTDEVIAALAAEAEAGYELSLAKGQRLGRPSLGSGVSPRVTFRTSRALYEAARQQAASEGRSISELAREALEKVVRRAG